MKLESFVREQWVSGRDLVDIHSAVTGDVVAHAVSGGLDMREVLAFARATGGKNLRRLTFHQRADMLKKLGQYLTERKDRPYKLSFQTGAAPRNRRLFQHNRPKRDIAGFLRDRIG